MISPVPLDAPEATDETRVGLKAARLATLLRQGLPVPPGFVVLPDANLENPAVLGALRHAYEALVTSEPARVVVRSSALGEDHAQASFAGQQLSILDITSQGAMLDAVRRVREAAQASHVRAYEQHMGAHAGRVAVLVQRQVGAVASGVAFGEDPVTGERLVVVEAAPGVGGATAGNVLPRAWRVRPAPGRWTVEATFVPPSPFDLPQHVVLRVAHLTLLAEFLFGAPQDIEWAWDGQEVWVLQARPITARRADDFFTARLPGDRWLWTAAFLNERFHAPVSPLGWSIVAGPFEELALRTPLRLLGADDVEGPLLKLWRGHPYSRVEVWQRIYKLFPDALLPEDAARYFPEGDVTLRRAPRLPRWGLHLVWNGLRALWTDRRGVSPLHNPAAWADYEYRLDAWMERFRAEEALLPRLPHDLAVETAQRLLREAQDLARELLALHRWSLLYAEVTYSLLRRLLQRLYGEEEGGRRAASATARVPSKTLELNAHLRELAHQAARRPDVLSLLEEAASLDELAARLGRDDPFVAACADFFARYGHRFFSLDLADPPYEATPRVVFRLIHAQAHLGGSEAPPPERADYPAWLAPLVRLTRDYLRLREDQRFAWQRLLAFQRRVALHLGQRWTEAGRLAAPDEIFGLTLDEVLNAEATPALGEVAARRLRRWRQLRQAFARAPDWHSPHFLRGTRPLLAGEPGTIWQGRPVSPGVARGRARVVRSPEEFDQVQKGDILVTFAADPGWTVLFERVAGLVTERGGQLSHAAVVAREYGLPAVAGVVGVVGAVKDGEELLVDGTQGIVVRLSSPEQERPE